MKGVAKLKDEARKYEQKEEWEKAIDAYLQVLKSTEGGDEEVDLPLYNRVGDLFVRLGKPADAVIHYEQAADKYAEAGLYNNAIALCNKALRYVPNRMELIRKLGQFSAAQGFLTDARRWYLEYAERQLKAGALDDAFKALEDFATVHEDAEIRELLGRQLKAYNRIDGAVAALKRAHSLRTQAGELDDAERLKAEILAFAPDAFAAGDDTATQVPVGPSRSTPKTRADDIEIWQPPPESPPVGGIELETAAGAAFGDAPDETGNVESPAFEAPAASDDSGGFDISAITIEGGNLGLGDALETTESLSGIDTSGLTFEGDLGGELPLIDIDSDDLPSFEIESAGMAGGLGLDLTPAADYPEEPLPLLDLEDALGELDIGSELPLLEGPGELSLSDFEMTAEVVESSAEVFDALPLETHHETTDAFEIAATESAELPDETLERPAAEAPFESEFAAPLEADEFDEVDSAPDIERAIDEAAPEETDQEPVFEEPVFDAPVFNEAALGEPTHEAPEFEGLAVEEALLEELDLEGPTLEEPDLEEPALEELVLEEAALTESEIPQPAIEEPVAEPRFDPAEGLRRGDALAASGDRAGAILHFNQLQTRLAAEGYHREAWQACTALLGLDPGNTRVLQQRVEYASTLNDHALLVTSYLALARNKVSTGAAAQAKDIFQRVLELDPENQEARKAVRGASPAASTGYVDLMAYIGEETPEESTRFVVAERPPTGDEERDFADMLTQFKQKVAEHVSVGEASAHYDLGLAFKEMGLIDEAISEFQTALKGGEERLKVYEELGQCFLLKQQYNVAVTVLTRALQMPVTDESALVGVYYALARAHEELGQRDEARRAYERVVGLDINFQDATRRLASL